MNSPVITYESVREFLQPEHYPALNHSIDLGLTNSPQRDKDESFWRSELEALELNFKNKLVHRFVNREIKHISIFAFAPMPLLMKLGTLINDIQNCEIHQPIRTPKTWKFEKTGEDIKYKIVKPSKHHSIVALNISLSATINNKRITDVLGENCSIFTLTIDEPFNDYLRKKEHLIDFSIVIRKLFDQIKLIYGSKTHLNIFPAMPIATAIELGRVWMPKADMPLNIYDENTINSGFFKAITISNQ
jgi:hypothetical protein